jgi:hypothetical protein
MRYSGGRVRIPLRGPWALAVGAICIGIAVYQGLVSSTLAARGIATEATVVDVDSRLRRNSYGRTYRLTHLRQFGPARGPESRRFARVGVVHGESVVPRKR